MNQTQTGSLTRTRPRLGFTLIELLVVIAIIAILAAILFPVFQGVRENARRTVCLSNEKQIGLAATMYTQDYDEGLPAWDEYWASVTQGLSPLPASSGGTHYWQAKLQPYIKSGNPDSDPFAVNNTDVWHCPDLGNKREQQYMTDAAGNNTSRLSYSYGINGMVSYSNYGGFPDIPPGPSGGKYYRWPKLQEMDNPASTIYVGECGYPGRIAPPFSYQTETKRTQGSNVYFSWEVPDRHNGGANYVFVDGHAKWFKSEIMYPPKSAGVKAAYQACANYFAYSAQERQDCLSRAQ